MSSRISRQWNAICVAAVIAMVLTACVPAAPGPAAPAAPAAEKAAPAAEQPRGTLKFWTFDYDPLVKKVMDDYVAEWNAAHPDLPVQYETFPWAQYTGEKLTTAIATGQGADIFYISPGDWRRYAEGGLALPLDEYFPQYLKDDLLPASLEAVTLNGHIYSVPFEMEPVALWYNKEMLEQAGLEPPKTWDELVTAAQKLTTPDVYGILIPTAADYYQNFVWYPFLWMAGGEVVDKDFTKALIDQTDGGAKALQLWGDLVAKYKVAPGSGVGPVDDRFPTEKAAMFVSGYWLYGWIKQTYPDFVEKVGVVRLPTPTADSKPVTVYGGWTVMVYSGTKFPKEAAEFAINLFGAQDPKRSVIWTTEVNTKLSPRKSVMEASKDFYANFPYSVFANDIFPTARAEPAYPPEIAKAVWESIQDCMFNGVSGEESARNMAEKINAYLATR
jgi:multiple sugar transport system substrate-binding protein